MKTEIKSIVMYLDAYTLIKENCPELINGLSEDFMTDLKHVDDWESYAYYIVNGKAVYICDSINGDKYSEYDSVEAFTAYTVEHVLKQMYSEFVIKYKVRSVPFWYEFKTIAENSDSAITAFLREYPIGIEKYYISACYSI